ncbi:MAG: APC family permease [Acidobacteria bacterium]|nr:APC family permease [Acidobacteriota bacterium]
MSLRRTLGTSDAAWMVVGNMVGAGIFVTPGLVALHLTGAGWILIAWALGGLLALAGAATYGELGARLPHAGGDYRFLYAAFGPLPAFLSGWAAFLLSFSAAAAAMALAVADNLQQTLPWLQGLGPWGSRLLGAALLLLLTATNAAGARLAGRTTILLTAAPLLGLAGLLAAGWLLGSDPVQGPGSWWALPARPWHLALGAALVPIYFTYSGWNAAAYVAGEIRDPGRSLPRGLLYGTLAVVALYVVVNLMLLLVTPAGALAGSTTAMSDAARRLLGPGAQRVLSAVIALAILGSANVTLMAGARIYYAMAGDRLAPRPLGAVNAAGVPGVALWTSGIWSALLVLSGRFDMLVGWATLAILLLSSLVVAGLFVLRRRGGEPPSYRCPGYPFTPAVYVVAALGVAVSSGFYNPPAALMGVAIIAAGVPAYYLFRRA